MSTKHLHLGYQICLGIAVLSTILAWKFDSPANWRPGAYPTASSIGLFTLPGLVALVLSLGGIAISRGKPVRVPEKYTGLAMIAASLLAVVVCLVGQLVIVGPTQSSIGLNLCLLACGAASGFALASMREGASAPLAASLLMVGCLLPWWTCEMRSFEQVSLEFRGAITPDANARRALERAVEKSGEWSSDLFRIGETSGGRVVRPYYCAGKVYGFNTWLGDLGIVATGAAFFLLLLPGRVPAKTAHLVVGAIGGVVLLTLLLWVVFAPRDNIGPFFQCGPSLLVAVPLLGAAMLAVGAAKNLAMSRSASSPAKDAVAMAP